MVDPMLAKANSRGRSAKIITPQLSHICCTVGETGINYDTTAEIYGGDPVAGGRKEAVNHDYKDDD
jgi:hypothetical protein